ncbi:hypothetical protein MLD38_018880 [Melastoma candidum]|uniref:Uncharacterized protein n=1 Tax=Melastoma candidum TaxID=119954 RepID=A0ACB9QYN3_9MYRT|nr:hypothetical protein MLD38_018880 [Melastoma candidum]
MGGDYYCKGDDQTPSTCSVLLELAASDDLSAFRKEVEERGCDVDEASSWYGRGFGSKKMGLLQRTPLMIAALFGSTDVLKYIIDSGKIDVNRACGSDKATALHCAVAGGSSSCHDVIKLLLDATADSERGDVDGNKPIDVIAIDPSAKSRGSSRIRALRLLLKGSSAVEDGARFQAVPQPPKEGNEKKEYPVDISLPNINNGIYGTDEFRMYTFKVKPCSRAYSHDWTECPFVHPGENARRRDPRKYPYSCVPCPEFRKGSCQKGDTCEYAHGVFESWLHPAQYRTRLCKDEIGCARKVCFFAHKPEELRPVYAATGSAMPTPKSYCSNPMEGLSPLSLNSSSLPLPASSTPPMSPLASSPRAMSMWQNKVNLTPPTLQLPGSRLKAALSARDLDLELEMLALENQVARHQQQKLMGELSGLSSPPWKNEFGRVLGDLKPTKFEDAFGSLDPSILSQMQGLSQEKASTPPPTQMQSPTGMRIRQNINPLRASYPNGLSSSPAGKSPPHMFDSSSAVAAAVMNSRSSAMTKRSQSFVDRSAVPQRSSNMGSVSSPTMKPNMSDWSSPDGKLDWGVQGDELNRLKKSASFGFRNNATTSTGPWVSPTVDEPDVSWVGSLVRDVPAADEEMYNEMGGSHELLPSWAEQVYIEQEQMA